MTERPARPAVSRSSTAPWPPLAGPSLVALVALVAIGVVGLALRVVGVGWGLPEGLHPDEQIVFGLAEQMSPGNLRPGFYIYPSFFIYQLAAARTLVVAAGGDYHHLVLAGRLLVVLYSCLTIGIVYALGARLGGRRAGLIAAALCAVSGALTLHAHYAVTDTPVTALATAAVWLSVRGWQRRSFAGLCAAAFIAGLAVSTKYSAAPVVLVPMFAVVAGALRPMRQDVGGATEGGTPAPGQPPSRHQPPTPSQPAGTPIARSILPALLLAAIALAAFALTSPYALIDYPDLIRDLELERALQAEARPGDHIAPLTELGLTDRGLVQNLPAIVADIGVVGSLLAFGCMGLVLVRLGNTLRQASRAVPGGTGPASAPSSPPEDGARDEDAAVAEKEGEGEGEGEEKQEETVSEATDSWDGIGWALAAAWVLLFYALMAPSAITGQRYMLPIYPLLMIFAAGGIERVVRKFGARLDSQAAPRRRSDSRGKRAARRGFPPPIRGLAILSAALLLAAAAQPAIAAVRSSALLAQTDTRLIAHAWALENLAPGSVFAREHYAPPFHTSDGFRVVAQPFSLTEHGFDAYCQQGIAYLWLSSTNSSRYFEENSARFAAERAWYRELELRTRLVQSFPGAEFQLHQPTIELRRLFCPD